MGEAALLMRNAMSEINHPEPRLDSGLNVLACNAWAVAEHNVGLEVGVIDKEER